MKNLKKLISVVLCVAMMASFLVVGTSAASYPDVTEEKSYYAAVELLSALGILKGDEEGNFNPDAEIKRSEFAAVVCRALGQENAATSTVSKFDDVAADHWAVGYIGWAAGKGIVNGYGDGNFGPDKAVTYQEAVKMLMAALGYEKLAQNNGGYPYGYLSLAGTYGVTAGLSADPEAAASRSLVAQLVYNALEAPLMDTSYYSSTEERYVVYDGSKAADYEERTILSQYLDIIKVKANVANNYKTVSTLWKKNGQPQVELDLLKVYNETDKEEYEDELYTYSGGNYYLATGLKVYEGATNASAYLAYDVDAYLFYNEDDNLELKAIITDSKSVETLEVAKDIVVANVDGNGVDFEYWEDIDSDSRTTEVDIAAAATVYVNGKEVGTLADADGEAAFEALAGSTSTVTFIGSKGEDFSKIFIVDYEYAQVESIDLEDEYITFNNGSIELSKDARGDKFVYTIYKDGAEIALEDIQVGDILSIVAPGSDLDKSDYVDIYVSSETLTGTVTGAKSGSQNHTFYIDKVEYTTVDANLLSVGDQGTFYLTADGKIYAAEATTTLSDNYGFILKVGSTQKFGENTWEIRLFTKDGAVKTYTIASTLKVTSWNGTKNVEDSYKRANNGQDAIMAQFDTWTKADASDATVYANAKQRLITFTDDGSTISKITLASDNVNKSDLRKAYDVEGFIGENFKPATGRFAGYTYTDATKLFYAPVEVIADGSADDGKYIIDEDSVALLSVSSLDEEKTDYAGYAYATNSDKELGAAVITSDLGFAGKGSALAVVISSAEGLNAEGERATEITVLQGGKTDSYAVDEDAKGYDLSAVETGDIIQFVLNGVNEITNAELIFDANYEADSVAGTPASPAFGLGKLGTYATAQNAVDGEVKYIYGVVGSVASGAIDLGMDYYEFDNDENTVTAGAADYGVNYEDGCTLAKIEASKVVTSPNSAVTKVSSVSAFRATKATYSDMYVMVARVVDDEIVDAVSYQLGSDATSAELNSHANYVITY